jgi:hypothetical protein
MSLRTAKPWAEAAVAPGKDVRDETARVPLLGCRLPHRLRRRERSVSPTLSGWGCCAHAGRPERWASGPGPRRHPSRARLSSRRRRRAAMDGDHEPAQHRLEQLRHRHGMQ